MMKYYIFKKIAGIGFIILGILGCMLPILPGFVFIIIGASLINENFAKKIRKCSSRYKFHRSKMKFFKELIKKEV